MHRRHFLIGGAGALVLAGAGSVSWRCATGSLDDYADYCRRLRAPLQPTGDSLELVRYATLAANGHNTQPWRFDLADDSICLKPDFSRRTAVVDPDDHHLYVSLGCAAENLVLAAAASGRPCEITGEPDHGLRFAFAAGPARTGPLFDAIPRRQSTRAAYDGQPLTAQELNSLENAVNEPGVDMILITRRPRMDAVRDLVIEGNSRQMTGPAFMRELKQWIRFNPDAARSTGDGLFAGASGNPSLPTVFGETAFDLLISAEAENRKYARQMDTASGLAVFVGEKEDPAHWISVGRACQRFALAATNLGLKHSFVNQPVEVAALRPELAALIGVPGRRPDLVLRFGRGPTLPYSPRRPVGAVIA